MRRRSKLPLRGYIGGLEELSASLEVSLEEARIFRLTVMELYLREYGESVVVEELSERGYATPIIIREWVRCDEINGQVTSMISMGLLPKGAAVGEFKNRVMSVGGDYGEVSKDEVVSILSGLLLDSRVQVQHKLAAADLLGKYRDYYKSVDRDIRIILEGGSPSSGGVTEAPVGMDVHGLNGVKKGVDG